MHIHTHIHKHKTDLMTNSNKHWGFCLSFAFSISTICIPSLQLPQPIQTAAILYRATHTRLPTEGHYCVSRPQLAQSNNQTVTAERKQLHFYGGLCKRFSLDSDKCFLYEQTQKNISLWSGILRILRGITAKCLDLCPQQPALCSHFKHSSVFQQWMGKTNPSTPVGSELCHSIPWSFTNLSIFHPEALLHPSISVPVGLPP